MQPDVAASLPPDAADKLRALRQRVDDLHRLLPEFEDQTFGGRGTACSRATAEAASRLISRTVASRCRDTDPRVIAAQRDLKTLTAESAAAQRQLRTEVRGVARGIR